MLGTTILLALREIRRHILRSILTTLGIIIGVAAVVTMVTLCASPGRVTTQSGPSIRQSAGAPSTVTLCAVRLSPLRQSSRLAAAAGLRSTCKVAVTRVASRPKRKSSCVVGTSHANG